MHIVKKFTFCKQRIILNNNMNNLCFSSTYLWIMVYIFFFLAHLRLMFASCSLHQNSNYFYQAKKKNQTSRHYHIIILTYSSMWTAGTSKDLLVMLKDDVSGWCWSSIALGGSVLSVSIGTSELSCGSDWSCSIGVSVDWSSMRVLSCVGWPGKDTSVGGVGCWQSSQLQ